MAAQRTLVLFSGLGADERLFEPQRSLPYRLITPRWIVPRARESLPDYARRMAAGIEWPQHFVLGGVSFGGMVAAELACGLKPDALVLIASCRSTQGIPSAHRFIDGLIRVVEDFGSGPAAGRSRETGPPRLFLTLFGDFNEAQRALMAEMLAETPLVTLRRASQMVRTWEGVGRLPCPAVQIHGARDLVIPVDKTSPDVVIPDGGHLINWTHAEQVNEAIRRLVDSLER